MSIALKFGDLADPTQLSGVIYLDSTTNYSKNFSGRVSSHPLGSGATVSDHFTSDNPRIEISGVISGADLSAFPSNLTIDGGRVLNSNPQPPAAIVSNLPSTLRKLVPDSLGQWIPNLVPAIIGGSSSRTDYKEEVEALLETIMTGVFFNEQRSRWQNRMTLITLYETVGSYSGKSIPNLVLTNYRTREDAESGDALFLDLTFEQVRFSTVERAEAPAPRRGTDIDKASKVSKDKGNEDPIETDSPITKGDGRIRTGDLGLRG